MLDWSQEIQSIDETESDKTDDGSHKCRGQSVSELEHSVGDEDILRLC